MKLAIKHMAILLLLFFQQQSVLAQQKQALIIAIGNYPKTSGWTAISSNADQKLVREALLRQGFPDTKIQVLRDSMATKAGITAALEALVKRVQTGDIVVLHFSSHGEQVEDDNGDEADGLDESIVSFGAVISTQSADFQKDQQQYFRDDLLGYYVKKLRQKLGPDGDLAVFINACHSGSGTRGNAKVRGGKAPLVSAGFDPGKYKGKAEEGLVVEREIEREGEGAHTGILSPYVIISAARADELDFEVKDDKDNGVGSLSYAFCKAVEQLGKETTYRALFARIQQVMLEKGLRQHPVLEGDGADRSLFGGRFNAQEPYTAIEKRITTREYLLKQGQLAGLDLGAKVAVYPAGTLQTEGQKALASGEIIQASLYSSRMKLSADPGLSNIAAGWVFVTEPVFKIPPVVMKLDAGPARSKDASFTTAEKAQWEQWIREQSASGLSADPDLVLVRGRSQDTLKVFNSGLSFSTIARTDNRKQEWLKQAAEDFMHYKFLRNLELSDAGTKVVVKLLPYRNGQVDSAFLQSRIRNGIYEFQAGDTLVLQVVNKGRQAIYVNLLDLQPDGVINSLMPDKSSGIFPEDLKVKGGETRIFDQYTIRLNPPYGTEVFKFFLSRTELDLEDLVTTRGNGERGSFSFLEKLVKRTYKSGTRGGVVSTGGVEGGVVTLSFVIKPSLTYPQ